MPSLDCGGCGSYFKRFLGTDGETLCQKCTEMAGVTDPGKQQVISVGFAF